MIAKATRLGTTAADALAADDSPDFITAVARAFAVLRSFKPRERYLGVREIARRTGLPKSTIGRICYTLTQLGYLEFLPAEEKYSLGIGVLSLAQHFLAGLDVRGIARPLMQELAEQVHSTVALAARDSDQMVFIEICHGHQLFRLSLEVGERVPRGTTALGRAGHVALSEEERARVLASYLKNVPQEEWPPIQKGLRRAVEDYDKYGFCFSVGEWNKGVSAVGVPLVLPSDGKLLAISCFGPAQEMTRERMIQEIGPKIVELRDRIKAKMGG
ncbi:IclR family transcriptional regulator [Pendulispora albinea]|uniref:IclR family transcriptional regulator n=1 Tax=Pendulispora albinea TaxID=2741071 RepID=A0ABZ2M7V1_9BACT